MWFWSSGRPLPEVVWLHNGQEVKESEDFHLLRAENRCTLLIQEVFPEDTGIYSCKARNQHGADSTQCALTVEGNVSAHHLQLRNVGPPFCRISGFVVLCQSPRTVSSPGSSPNQER